MTRGGPAPSRRWRRPHAGAPGILDVEGLAVHLAPLAALREKDPDGMAAGESAGADMTLAEAIALALPDAEPSLGETMALW